MIDTEPGVSSVQVFRPIRGMNHANDLGAAGTPLAV